MAPDTLTSIPSRKLGVYWVGVYLVWRTYGGHEGGGWNYQYGELVCSPHVYQTIGQWPAAFPTEAEAKAYAEKMAAGINQLNANRASLDRPIKGSAGRYVTRVFNAPTLPSTFPINTPQYEQYVQSASSLEST